MTNPVPGYGQSTPYGRRGPYWGCDPDAYGNGKHTGADYAAPSGARVVAARGGTVRHVNYGSAFGSHQFAIFPGDGTRDFYAHTKTRPADGTKVKTGDNVAKVGAEGNVTGAHLHFERHGTDSGGWSCGVVRDPAPSINAKTPEDDMPISEQDLEAIAARVNRTIGDYTADGTKKQDTEGERADQRLRQIENVVRDILARVKKIENQVN